MEPSSYAGVNIVSWIIGSGLVVFGASTIYSDFIKQPQINLDVYENDRDNSQIKSTLDIWNFGLTGANNITIAIDAYP